MKRTTKHRLLIERLVFTALVVCGVAVGYALGCSLAVVEAREWLDHSCLALQAQDNAAMAEARNILHAIQGSPLGLCSDSEIANFRALVFRSEYVKDAGRVRDGRILCSATSGRPEQVIGPFKADIRQQDGTTIYHDLSPMRTTGVKRAALQLGNAYAVFGMQPPPESSNIPAKLEITTKTSEAQGASTAATVAASDIPAYKTTEGEGRVGNTLYVTRCSEFNCVTATARVSDALHGASDVIYSSAFGGAMAGILCALAFSFQFNRNRETSQQLRRAVQRGELDVLYQPIVNLETGEVVGAEALARWTDEDGNAVNPEIFIKTAEDLGFAKSITRVVLKRILQDFAPTLQKRSGFHISLNVSAEDLLDPAFLPMLQDALRNADLQPPSLAIEITERSATNDERAMDTIRQLRRLGHGIHVDDFGAGYSNLDRLLCLYSDTIKIDKAFTRLIGTESVAAVILPQIMDLAKSLNLGVVVEGVETIRQADYFSPGTQRIYAQGWLFGRPMTAEAFLSQLANGRVSSQALAEGWQVLTINPAR